MSGSARKSKANQILDNLVPFPTGWLLVRKVFGRVWKLGVSVLANVWVGVFFLMGWDFFDGLVVCIVMGLCLCGREWGGGG